MFLFFVVVLAMIDKKVGQIDFPLILLVFAEAYGVDQILIGEVSIEKCMMYTAKIDEIQATARHDKQRLGVAFGAFGKVFGKVCDMTDAAMQMELADTDQLIVDTRFICHAFLTVGNTAFQTNIFLILFRLYR